jgi:predicted NAD-dependent protein-ADP-ribosyltransferase YbiA (DUF1768 family)
MAILFYSPNDSYGCFSNFSRHEVHIYGHTWKTSEAAFQAMKFHPHRPDLVKLVLEADSPGKAARLGRDRSYPLRPDWDMTPNSSVLESLIQKPQPDDGINRCGVTIEPLFARNKDFFMYEIVLTKVIQHQSIYDTLVGTGKEPIIEDSIHDPYWGWGSSKVGENKLGRILMYVRNDLLSQ